MVKNPLASAGDARVAGSIPGSASSPGVGNATHSSILAWKIPWTEKPGSYSPWGHKGDANERTHSHPSSSL